MSGGPSYAKRLDAMTARWRETAEAARQERDMSNSDAALGWTVMAQTLEKCADEIEKMIHRRPRGS